MSPKPPDSGPSPPMTPNFKLLAALIVSLAVAWSAPAARAVPLPAPLGPGVRYFGYWGSAAQGVEGQSPAVDDPGPSCNADKWTGYTGCIKDHANVTHITFGLGQEDWALARLQEAADLKMGVVLTVWNYFFKARADNTRKVDLVDGYQAQWMKFLSRIDDPYIKRSHTIIGFYLYDELRFVDAQTIVTLGTVAKLLAETAPDVHRWVTFTAQDVDLGTFTIPADIDWLSYNCYGVDGASPSFAHCAPTYQGYEYKSLDYYRLKLKELIKKTPNYHPRLVLIPQAFLPPGAANLQADLIKARLGPEIAMAKSDPGLRDDHAVPLAGGDLAARGQALPPVGGSGHHGRLAGCLADATQDADPSSRTALAATPSRGLRLRPPCRLEPRLFSPPLQLQPALRLSYGLEPSAPRRGAASLSACPRAGRQLAPADTCAAADLCALPL